MNNSNECNGNHAMLVILFSVACPSAPPPPQPPTSLQEQENKLQEQRHVSHISTVISLHYSQSKRRDIRQSGNTYRSTAALFHLSPNTHTHTHTSHVLYVFWPFYLARCVRTQLEVTLIGAVASLAGGIDRLRQ